MKPAPPVTKQREPSIERFKSDDIRIQTEMKTGKEWLASGKKKILKRLVQQWLKPGQMQALISPH
jgi:hypothetical protein